MEQFADVLKMLGLDPRFLGVAVVAAVLLRFARAAFKRFGPGWTYSASAALGAIGAVLKAAETDNWRDVAVNGLALTAVVLVLQMALQQGAKFLPWLPTDNSLTKGGNP